MNTTQKKVTISFNAVDGTSTNERTRESRRAFIHKHRSKFFCKSDQALAKKLAESISRPEKPIYAALSSWIKGWVKVSSSSGLFEAMAKLFNVSAEEILSLSELPEKDGPRSRAVRRRIGGNIFFVSNHFELNAAEDITEFIPSLPQRSITVGELLFELVAFIEKRKIRLKIFPELNDVTKP